MATATDVAMSLALLLGTQAAAMLTPGPNMLLLLSIVELRLHTLKYVVVGFAVAGLLFSVMSVLVLQFAYGGQLEGPRCMVQLLGAGYLIYSGTSLVRRAGGGAKIAAARAPMLRGELFLAGFATNAANPKTLAFFSSILAIYLAHVGTSAPAIGIAIIAIFFNSLLTHMIIGRALRTSVIRRGYARWGRPIRLGTGSLFIVIGFGFAAAAAVSLLGLLLA